MITAAAQERENYLNASYGIKSWLLTKDHKRIALLYLFTVTLFFFIGGAFATLIRVELLTPQGDLVSAVRKLKAEPGEGLVIFGSGTIVSQLAQENLIDEYQVVANPVILGKGRTMFDGIKEKLSLKLTKTRAFGNGNVFMCYQLAA